MPNVEIEINPVKFITIGTVGPKGKRRFYLQAGDDKQLISLTIEKEQARRLAEAIAELLDELKKREGEKLGSDQPDMNRLNMDLREPIEDTFRVAQMGLGYDDEHDMVVLITQEVVTSDQDAEDPEAGETPDALVTPPPSGEQPSVARFWGTRAQMRALALHTSGVVKQGRPDPAHNGRILYYWT